MRTSSARSFGLIATLMLLSGCGSFDAVRPTSRMELLEPTSAFHLHVAPFANADISSGAQIPVVGEVFRNGVTYRVVKLPDEAVRGFFITVDDHGKMIDSVNAFNGRRLDLSPPEPPDVRLLPMQQAKNVALESWGAPKAHANSSSNVAEHPKENWLDVPCDIVVTSARDECASQHRAAGIPDNRTAATANSSESEPPQTVGEARVDDVGPPAEVSPDGEEIAPAFARSCYAGSGYRPVIDTQGVDTGQLECDLEECQAYAAQISPARSAVSNAIGGAIFGALFGLAVGDHGWAARAGAQGGAIGGALGGAGSAVAAQTNIVRNCMAGRGYRVLQ